MNTAHRSLLTAHPLNRPWCAAILIAHYGTPRLRDRLASAARLIARALRGIPARPPGDFTDPDTAYGLR